MPHLLQYNFNISYCKPYRTTAFVALGGMGFAFRLLAFAFLWYSCTFRRH